MCIYFVLNKYYYIIILYGGSHASDILLHVLMGVSVAMLFNFGKCKCLHIGPGNTGMNYEMGGTILSKTVKEKDLGVTMNANMIVSEQCIIAASKGNQILGMIRRNLTYKEKSLIIPLYQAIVRPHLEYCIQA